MASRGERNNSRFGNNNKNSLRSASSGGKSSLKLSNGSHSGEEVLRADEEIARKVNRELNLPPRQRKQPERWVPPAAEGYGGLHGVEHAVEEAVERSKAAKLQKTLRTNAKRASSPASDSAGLKRRGPHRGGAAADKPAKRRVLPERAFSSDDESEEEEEEEEEEEPHPKSKGRGPGRRKNTGEPGVNSRELRALVRSNPSDSPPLSARRSRSGRAGEDGNSRRGGLASESDADGSVPKTRQAAQRAKQAIRINNEEMDEDGEEEEESDEEGEDDENSDDSDKGEEGEEDGEDEEGDEDEDEDGEGEEEEEDEEEEEEDEEEEEEDAGETDRPLRPRSAKLANTTNEQGRRAGRGPGRRGRKPTRQKKNPWGVKTCPMVKAKKHWYRGHVIEEKPDKIKIDVPGCPDHSEPFWLSKDSERLWRGSHKGKDWKHLGDGAWEPKITERKPKGRKSRRRKLGLPDSGNSEEGASRPTSSQGRPPKRQLADSSGPSRPVGRGKYPRRPATSPLIIKVECENRSSPSRSRSASPQRGSDAGEGNADAKRKSEPAAEAAQESSDEDMEDAGSDMSSRGNDESDAPRSESDAGPAGDSSGADMPSGNSGSPPRGGSSETQGGSGAADRAAAPPLGVKSDPDRNGPRSVSGDKSDKSSGGAATAAAGPAGPPRMAKSDATSSGRSAAGAVDKNAMEPVEEARRDSPRDSPERTVREEPQVGASAEPQGGRGGDSKPDATEGAAKEAVGAAPEKECVPDGEQEGSGGKEEGVVDPKTPNGGGGVGVVDGPASAMTEEKPDEGGRSSGGAHSSSVDTPPGAARDGCPSAAERLSAADSGHKLPMAKRPRVEASAAEPADVLSPSPKTAMNEVTAPKTPAEHLPPAAKPTPDVPCSTSADEEVPKSVLGGVKREGHPTAEDPGGVEGRAAGIAYVHDSPDNVAPAGLEMKPTPETPRPRTKHRRKPEVRRGLDTYVEEPALIKLEQAAAAARLKQSAEEELLACQENLEGPDEISIHRMGHKAAWKANNRLLSRNLQSEDDAEGEAPPPRPVPSRGRGGRRGRGGFRGGRTMGSSATPAAADSDDSDPEMESWVNRHKPPPVRGGIAKGRGRRGGRGAGAKQRWDKYRAEKAKAEAEGVPFVYSTKKAAEQAAAAAAAAATSAAAASLIAAASVESTTPAVATAPTTPAGTPAGNAPSSPSARLGATRTGRRIKQRRWESDHEDSPPPEKGERAAPGPLPLAARPPKRPAVFHGAVSLTVFHDLVKRLPSNKEPCEPGDLNDMYNIIAAVANSPLEFSAHTNNLMRHWQRPHGSSFGGAISLLTCMERSRYNTGVTGQRPVPPAHLNGGAARKPPIPLFVPNRVNALS